MPNIINTTAPKMISIRKLNESKFEIPVYQRGFRWTRQQIKELIDDLYELSKDANRSTYCLQNVTVRKKQTKTERLFMRLSTVSKD